jgi:hypothetical protein
MIRYICNSYQPSVFKWMMVNPCSAWAFKMDGCLVIYFYCEESLAIFDLNYSETEVKVDLDMSNIVILGEYKQRIRNNPKKAKQVINY